MLVHETLWCSRASCDNRSNCTARYFLQAVGSPSVHSCSFRACVFALLIVCPWTPSSGMDSGALLIHWKKELCEQGNTKFWQRIRLLQQFVVQQLPNWKISGIKNVCQFSYNYNVNYLIKFVIHPNILKRFKKSFEKMWIQFIYDKNNKYLCYTFKNIVAWNYNITMGC